MPSWWSSLNSALVRNALTQRIYRAIYHPKAYLPSHRRFDSQEKYTKQSRQQCVAITLVIFTIVMLVTTMLYIIGIFPFDHGIGGEISTSISTSTSTTTTTTSPIINNTQTVLNQLKDKLSPRSGLAEKDIARVIQPVHDALTHARRDRIRDAMIHAWTGYETYAFGHDEIRPVTNRTNDSWGGWGVTLVDALDTLMIMGLDEQLARARVHVTTINFDKDYKASFFETAIRYLGGLLSAHSLSGDVLYLNKARELADLLMYGFDSTASGLPQSTLNLHTHVSANHGWAGSASILAEVGSIQLEMAYLSYHTGDERYYRKARAVFTLLDGLKKDKEGLYPIYIDPATGRFSSQRVSVGSFGDSFYEYLLKLYILTDKTDHDSLRMYTESADGIIRDLMRKKTIKVKGTDKTREFAFIGELNGDILLGKQEHLSCFVPGMLALGAQMGNNIPQQPSTAETRLYRASSTHLSSATLLTSTCAELYSQMATGLAPEAVTFESPTLPHPNQDGYIEVDSPSQLLGTLFTIDQSKYILRPETVESLFILWRITHDPIYRDWGWSMFESLERSCRTPAAYSGLKDVNHDTSSDGSEHPNWNDSMESFFLAETLKYLYLLFSEDDVIPLDQYVFTTEAHPLAILKNFAWSPTTAPVASS